MRKEKENYKMRILIDIGHPCDLHLYKHFVREMQKRGHVALFTCRDKDHLASMLAREGLPFKSFGPNHKSIIGKISGLPRFTWRVWQVARKFKPDVFMSSGSMYAAPVAFWQQKGHIVFEDTYNWEQVVLYKPFTRTIMTGDYDHPMKSKKIIRYAGNHELAYLHPKRFKPDGSVLNEMGINDGEKHVIIRFVSWTASHDIGHDGISLENKVKAVQTFAMHARVFISSEEPLPPELEDYRFSLPRHRMHDAMAFASLVFGESATMASEAAVMGVPAIYLDNTGRGYTQELEEKYGLVFNFSESETDQLAAIAMGKQILQQPAAQNTWHKKRQRMLDDKIDVTGFMVWFVENYPNSVTTMKESPEYQHCFK